MAEDQQTERWTILVCDKHLEAQVLADPAEELYCPDCSPLDSFPGPEARHFHAVEVVPAHTADRLAEAAERLLTITRSVRPSTVTRDAMTELTRALADFRAGCSKEGQ